MNATVSTRHLKASHARSILTIATRYHVRTAPPVSTKLTVMIVIVISDMKEKTVRLISQNALVDLVKMEDSVMKCLIRQTISLVLLNAIYFRMSSPTKVPADTCAYALLVSKV